MNSGPIEARPANDTARYVPRPSAATRGWSALLFVATASVLGIAIWLKPDPRGFGTHEQLGARPCGMILLTGFPCPTCGMTTAFAHTVRGQLISAARAQPAGLVFALLTVITSLGALFAIFAGRPPRAWNWLLMRVPAHWIFLTLLIVLLVGWGEKLIVGLATGVLPVHSHILSS